MDTLPDDVRRLVEHLVSSIQAQDRSLHGLTQLLNRVEEECSALHCITRNEVQANDSSPRLEPVDISDAPDEMPELFDGPDSSDDDSDSAKMDKHLSPTPPEPRLIEVLHDSWENISDEHIHPQVTPSRQPAEYRAGSHTHIPIMHCENSSPQEEPDISPQRLAKLWLTDKEASIDDWVLLHHRGFKRLWECDLKSSNNTRWCDASPAQRASFCVSAGLFAKSLTKCKSYDRVCLRLSGGWEQFLRDSLQISVSLWSSPLATPTVEFSMSPLLRDGMGSLSGPLDQQILRALGKGE